MTPNAPNSAGTGSRPTRRTLLRAGAVAPLLGSPFLGTGAMAQQQATAPTEAIRYQPPNALVAHFHTLFGRQLIQPSNVSVSLPALAENGNSVALSVSADTPDDDAIEHLLVFAERNPLPDIVRLRFHDAAPTQTADLRIRLSDSQNIVAVAVTKRGELYAGDASIIVTLAACVDIPAAESNDAPNTVSGGNTTARKETDSALQSTSYLPTEPFAQLQQAQWKTRLAVANNPSDKQRLRIRTLIAHPMESGFRINDSGQPIPRDIIKHFHCDLLNRRAVTAALFPAVAANPYLSFEVPAPESTGPLRCVWIDQQGAWANAQTELSSTA